MYKDTFCNDQPKHKENNIYFLVYVSGGHILPLYQSFASTKDDTISRYKAPKDQEPSAKGTSSGLKSITAIGL
jgi:hypothetical protein